MIDENYYLKQRAPVRFYDVGSFLMVCSGCRMYICKSNFSFLVCSGILSTAF